MVCYFAHLLFSNFPYQILTFQEGGNPDAADDDDIIVEPPKRSGGRRTGISAEPIKEDDTEYKKVVIPKDDATRRSLESAMRKNLLFAHLEVNKFPKKFLITLNFYSIFWFLGG